MSTPCVHVKMEVLSKQTISFDMRWLSDRFPKVGRQCKLLHFHIFLHVVFNLISLRPTVRKFLFCFSTLERPKCWPIRILPFDFSYLFIAGSYTYIAVNSLNTKRTSSLEKSLSENYTHIPGCQKSRTFHIRIKKNRVSHILYVENWGLIIYLAALKSGPFGTHIRTMPYIGSYPLPLN